MEGRESEFKFVVEATKQSASRTAIAGDRGMGKTTLAAKVVYNLQAVHSDWLFFQVSGSSLAAAKRDLISLSRCEKVVRAVLLFFLCVSTCMCASVCVLCFYENARVFFCVSFLLKMFVPFFSDFSVHAFIKKFQFASLC
jgi:AAA+ ATPase superfamily predicted ATPase